MEVTLLCFISSLFTTLFMYENFLEEVFIKLKKEMNNFFFTQYAFFLSGFCITRIILYVMHDNINVITISVIFSICFIINMFNYLYFSKIIQKQVK